MPASQPFRIDGLVDDGTDPVGAARPAAKPPEPVRRPPVSSPRPASETAQGPRPTVVVAPRRAPSRLPIYAGAGVLALAALLAGGWFFFWRSDAPTPSTAQTRPAATPPVTTPAPAPVAASTEGLVTVDSRPSGAAVSVDGRARGVTPMQLTLPIGNHTLELGEGASKRVVPITVSAGVVVSEHFESSVARHSGRGAGRRRSRARGDDGPAGNHVNAGWRAGDGGQRPPRRDAADAQRR